MALSSTLPQYAQPADLLNTGVNAAALTNVSPASQIAALQEASGYINSRLANQFQLPILTWGADIRGVCVQIAAWFCLKARGFNPTKDADKTVYDAYLDAVKWLDSVSAGKFTPDQLVDSGGGAIESSAPRVLSPAPMNSTGTNLRGW